MSAYASIGCRGNVRHDSWMTFNALTASLFSITESASALIRIDRKWRTHRKRY